MPEPLPRIPAQIVQLTTPAWNLETTEFPSSDGWVVTYYFNGPTPFDRNATPDGDAWLVQLTTTETGSPAGAYSWQAFAKRDTPQFERYLVAEGRLEIRASAITPSSADQRSHTRRVIEALEARLEDRATDGQLRMGINGRSLDRIPIAEIADLLSTYRMRLRAEEAAELQGATPGKRRRVKVRF